MKKQIKIYTFLIVLAGFGSNVWSQSDELDSLKTGKTNIAYGEQYLNNVSSSISTISGDDLMKGSINNFGNALFGKLSGLYVTQGGGEPGDDSPTFRVRGATRPPLIIIDGFERSLDDIAPEEVESVSLLKDASAVALYGMKGANGVLLVTTKRGTSQKGRITFSAQSGLQMMENMPEILGATEYMNMYNEAAANDGLPMQYSQAHIDANGTSPRYPDVNWKDLILKDFSNVSKANLGLQGGSDYIKYFVNFGFLYNDGMYKPENPDMMSNANLTRFNVRSNIDVSISKSTTFSMDLAGSIKKGVVPAFDGVLIWNAMMTLPPNAFNVRNPDDSYGGSSILMNNPVGMLETGGRNNNMRHFLNAGFKLKQDFDFITEGLSASLGYVIDNGAGTSDGNWRFFQVKQIVPGTGEDYKYYSYRENTGYNDWSNTSSTRYMNLNADIVYDMPEQNGNELNVLVRFQNDQQYLSNSDLSPYLTNNLGARVLYAKNKTYLLELAASYFGSDQYAEGKKYGVFPSASAGWVFSNEGFAEDSELLTYGKLKASYGITGYNRYVNGRYPYSQFYTGGGGFPLGIDWGMVWGVQPGRLANPETKWEVSNKLNIGLELELSNRFSLSADYYMDKRTDVLYMDYNRPSTTGATLPWENIGEMTNTGIDLELGYHSNEGDLKWHTDLVFSYYDNVIDEMGESLNEGNLAHLNRTGNSSSAIYGYESLGLFESAADIQSSAVQTFGTPRIGDLKYKDQNGDNVIDSRDMTVIGDYMGNIDLGLRIGLEYKNFDFEAMFQGQFNKDIDLSNNSLAQPFIYGNAATEIAKEDGFPALTLSNMNNYQSSSYWVRTGDFVKLRNIELGYSLSESTSKRLNMQRVRFFVRGVNILTLSDWKFSDPEFTHIGYPPMKSYLLGLNINF